MESMYALAEKLFPICRSITGDGVRETLQILKSEIEDLRIMEVPSGTEVFDWTVPKEWRIRDAFIENSKGEKVVDFRENNLHVMGYSIPVDRVVGLSELKQYIYVEDSDEEAIPYVTSYYKERYGFCMSKAQRDALPEDSYHMVIDSELFDGSLTYGEVILPGQTDEEIFLSTYICHPSMANNELSGPCVAAKLYQMLKNRKERKYTYRIVFIPETIGSITYLSRNLETMKSRVVAGFNISCVGDDRTYSYIASRYGDTLADKVAKNVLRFHYPEYISYSYLERGSDERQYNAPGVDLPVCAICRSKYGEYPEYHTSKDNLSLITEEGLYGAYEVYEQCIEALERNAYYQIQCICEPQLGKRGLYPTVSKKGSYDEIRAMTNFIAYADGTNDLIDISNRIGVPVKVLLPILDQLLEAELIQPVENRKNREDA